MKKSKAVFWFKLWGISIAIGATFSAIQILKHGGMLATPSFEGYQIFLLLVFLPFILLPMLCISYYHALKEKNKKIRIASLILILHHIICIIAVLFQLY